MRDPVYIAIDLKSFYASVECVERGLDPLTTHLVVADAARTNKTICLAVSPALKAYGIPGRPRLFQVVQQVQSINAKRRMQAPGHTLSGSSWNETELRSAPKRALSYITATPRMALYLAYSARIYGIYLRYVAPEDIHVYSIDEVFIDATPYLASSGLSPRAFAARFIHDVLQETGITATAGIGTNLYLCKVAMDIVAKHVRPDADGMRIATLDEMRYRRLLWTHRPLTDFWRVGHGYAKKLEACGLYTMGDIARCSLGGSQDFYNADLLFRLFGVNAELLIDHAWGWESCTMKDIKAYRPSAHSLGSGQVLQKPYTWSSARLVVREMADQLMLDLVEKALITDQLVLTIGYDTASLDDPQLAQSLASTIKTDPYGRRHPRHAHGTTRLSAPTNSAQQAVPAVLALYDRITDHRLLIRRINLTAAHTQSHSAQSTAHWEQLSLFSASTSSDLSPHALEQEARMQQTVLHLKQKYGRNVLIKAMSLQPDATAVTRNAQIGGHRA